MGFHHCGFCNTDPCACRKEYPSIRYSRIDGTEPKGKRFLVAYPHKGEWVYCVAKKDRLGRWLSSPVGSHVHPKLKAEIEPVGMSPRSLI